MNQVFKRDRAHRNSMHQHFLRWQTIFNHDLRYDDAGRLHSVFWCQAIVRLLI